MEIRRTPMALAVATTAGIGYSAFTLLAAIFPSVAAQLVASILQLDDSVLVDHLYSVNVENFVFGLAIVLTLSWVTAWMFFALYSGFANVGSRRALHILPMPPATSGSHAHKAA